MLGLELSNVKTRPLISRALKVVGRLKRDIWCRVECNVVWTNWPELGPLNACYNYRQKKRIEAIPIRFVTDGMLVSTVKQCLEQVQPFDEAVLIAGADRDMAVIDLDIQILNQLDAI